MENNLTLIKDQFKELPNNIEAEQSLIGSILGIILSYLIVILQEKFHIISLPENIYFVSYLPMTFSIKESFYILGVSIVSSVIFSSFALSQILSINPSRILKN